MASNVEFDILARDKASKTFDNVAKSSDGLGSKLGKLSKGALLGVGVAAAAGAAVGIGALGAAMVQGVKDAASYQQLADKTAAVLKSTGNASHQSVKGIQARAAALESLSGVDEEVIINGQNVLATFTNVRDGVGKGNDIFNQATQAALNMSSALGTDLQGATIKIGKALNDPVKGLTALGKVGVTFTKQQQDQIKTMVKSGNTMGAQKIILGELSKKYDGAAKAAGKGFEGSLSRAKDAVQDAFRAIGTKLLPAVTRLADYIAKHAGPWIDKMAGAVGRLWHWASTKLWPALEHGYQAVMPGLKSAFHTVSTFVTGTLVPAIQKFGNWIKTDLWPAIQKGYQTIMPALKQAFSIVAGAFKSTGKDGEGFGGVVKKIGEFITKVAIPAISTIAKVALPILASGLRINIEAVKILWRVFETLSGVVGKVIAFILRRFADLASMWAGVLRALAKVPGFGWAKGAADKLDHAAGKASALASSIERIPNHKNVDITFSVGGVSKSKGGGSSTVGGRVWVPGVGWVNAGARAGGGPVRAGHPYIVGEKGPEMIVPGHSGTVITADNTRRAMAGGSSSSSLGGGDTFNVYVGPGTTREQAMELLTEFLKLKRQRGVNLGLA